MEDIGAFQLAEIVINRFVINGSIFAFQTFGNRSDKESPSSVVKNELHNALQLIQLANLIASYNIRKIVEL